MKKTLLLLAATVFAIFAFLNLNDADPLPWVASYLGSAALMALGAFGIGDRRVTLALAVALLAWMCTMFPGMIDWAREGFPTITGTMKAENPHVEVVREFLGLAIAVAALAGLWLATPRGARLTGNDME